MEYLPCEMIEHIYSFLPYYDKMRATEVCQRWKEILETKIIKDTLLRIDGKEIEIKEQTFCGVIQRIAQTERLYQDFIIEGIDFINLDRYVQIQQAVLFANLGLFVRNFTLKKCRLTYCKLFQIVHLMKNLQKLSIDHCSIYFDNYPLFMFVPKFSNLKTIGIHNIKTEDETLVIDMLSSGNSADIELTIDDSCTEDKTEVIARYADRVKYLSCTFYQSNTVRKIFEQRGLNLHTLQLQRKALNQMHCTILLETLPTQRNLQRLCIDTPISARVLVNIAEHLDCLEFLSVTIAEDDDMEPITTSWPKLKVLHLSQSRKLSQSFAGMNFAILEELRLHTEVLSKYAVTHIYENCTTLKRLGLSALSMIRCDEMLGSIELYLPLLESIDVQCSSRTTFIPFFKSIELLPQFTSLALFFCEKITDETIALINVPFLRSFSITRNRKISKIGLHSLFTNCPRIQCLTISGCEAINDEAVEIISTLLPRLEYLDISESIGITLNSVRHIMLGLPFLRDLRMDKCHRLLTQWRYAPYYIDHINSLRKYHDTYPEFFYYDLPVEPVNEYDSDECYYYDSASETSDLEDFPVNENDQAINQVVQDDPNVSGSDDIIVLSDDNEDADL